MTVLHCRETFLHEQLCKMYDQVVHHGNSPGAVKFQFLGSYGSLIFYDRIWNCDNACFCSDCDTNKPLEISVGTLYLRSFEPPTIWSVFKFNYCHSPYIVYLDNCLEHFTLFSLENWFFLPNHKVWSAAIGIPASGKLWSFWSAAIHFVSVSLTLVVFHSFFS